MLRLLGLDIGTTSISAVVLDGDNGTVLHAETVMNGTDMPADNSYNKLQNAEIIAEKVLNLKEKLVTEFAPIATIGVTGQMHGILYYDQNGKAVSPLYTWQDQSGAVKLENKTYAEYLTEKTGYRLASGYGLVTDYVLRDKNAVPENAVGFTTIHDYIVMLLTDRKRPLMHSTDAASLGCFSLEARDFDRKAVAALGTPESFLPEVTDGFTVAGKDRNGVPVAVAIGDNQASIAGVASENQKVFVNIGTGSQVSVITDKATALDGVEVRPFFDGKNLIVGAPLFGGRSYSLLKSFFGECADAFGAKNQNIYAVMDKLSEENPSEHSLEVDTRFAGTRQEPNIRGAITNISEQNFTVAELTKGFLWGMAEELCGLYKLMQGSDGDADTMVGSGNAIRKGKVLRGYLEEQFKLKLNIPQSQEEASCGAAFFAGVSAGLFETLTEAQSKNVKYIDYN